DDPARSHPCADRGLTPDALDPARRGPGPILSLLGYPSLAYFMSGDMPLRTPLSFFSGISGGRHRRPRRGRPLSAPVRRLDRSHVVQGVAALEVSPRSGV